MSTPRCREPFKSIVVSFLERGEADTIKLKNSPAYVSEWIQREQNRRPNE
jgi:hypothetical protein